jgi:hypothetical protein
MSTPHLGDDQIPSSPWNDTLETSDFPPNEHILWSKVFHRPLTDKETEELNQFAHSKFGVVFAPTPSPSHPGDDPLPLEPLEPLDGREVDRELKALANAQLTAALKRARAAEAKLRDIEAQGAPAGWRPDRRVLGRAIYMAMYGDKGAKWEANEHQNLWVGYADRVISMLAGGHSTAEPETPNSAPGAEPWASTLSWLDAFQKGYALGLRQVDHPPPAADASEVERLSLAATHPELVGKLASAPTVLDGLQQYRNGEWETRSLLWQILACIPSAALRPAPSEEQVERAKRALHECGENRRELTARNMHEPYEREKYESLNKWDLQELDEDARAILASAEAALVAAQETMREKAAQITDRRGDPTASILIRALPIPAAKPEGE